MVVQREGYSLPVTDFYKSVSLTSTSNTPHLPTRKTNKAMSSPTSAPYSTDPLFAVSKGATPKQPRVCCLHIHLGKDTQRWHFLSAHCHKPGDLSATTRPAVNWAHFMEPAGDYLQLSAPQCLCTSLKNVCQQLCFFQYSESDSIMGCSLPESSTSHFTMTYGVQQ